MSNTVFQIRRNSVSGVRPTTSSIQSGELALNLTDGIAFSTNGTVVFELGANNTNVNVTGNATIKAIIANGSIGSANQVLTSNGSGIYWTIAGPSNINTAAQYTWSNTNTFQANLVANSNLMLVNSVALMSNTYTFTNSSVAANVDLVSTSTYRSFEYTIQLADTTLATPSHHITKILIVHNGTTTYMTEYGTVFSSINLGTFTSGISAGNLYLQLTPNSANVVCKFMRTAIAI
jgi:hypothetical protein